MSWTKENAPQTRFAKRCGSSVPDSIAYIVDHQGQSLEATSSRNFRESREIILVDFLSGRSRQDELSHSLMAEHVVQLSLNPALQRLGFAAAIAPQSLEHGKDQKGVDLIISDTNNLVYMGIDVKLREKRRTFPDRDGYGWSDTLRSPYFYLSLGNWRIDMREREEVPIRDWLTEYTIPSITGSKQIPRVAAFRDYLIGRIGRSIEAYRKRLDDTEFESGIYIIPDAQEDQQILREKLAVMHGVFTKQLRPAA